MYLFLGIIAKMRPFVNSNQDLWEWAIMTGAFISPQDILGKAMTMFLLGTVIRTHKKHHFQWEKLVREKRIDREKNKGANLGLLWGFL